MFVCVMFCFFPAKSRWYFGSPRCYNEQRNYVLYNSSPRAILPHTEQNETNRECHLTRSLCWWRICPAQSSEIDMKILFLIHNILLHYNKMSILLTLQTLQYLVFCILQYLVSYNSSTFPFIKIALALVILLKFQITNEIIHHL